ncbi:MAG TPA: hypothetical protein PKH26_03975 [Phycisphaerae bacterium]|nr:hypothetical protein [Phycisphaerae bacterium]
MFRKLMCLSQVAFVMLVVFGSRCTPSQQGALPEDAERPSFEIPLDAPESGPVEDGDPTIAAIEGNPVVLMTTSQKGALHVSAKTDDAGHPERLQAVSYFPAGVTNASTGVYFHYADSGRLSQVVDAISDVTLRIEWQDGQHGTVRALRGDAILADSIPIELPTPTARLLRPSERVVIDATRSARHSDRARSPLRHLTVSVATESCPKNVYVDCRWQASPRRPNGELLPAQTFTVAGPTKAQPIDAHTFLAEFDLPPAEGYDATASGDECTLRDGIVAVIPSPLDEGDVLCGAAGLASLGLLAVICQAVDAMHDLWEVPCNQQRVIVPGPTLLVDLSVFAAFDVPPYAMWTESSAVVDGSTGTDFTKAVTLNGGPVCDKRDWGVDVNWAPGSESDPVSVLETSEQITYTIKGTSRNQGVGHNAGFSITGSPSHRLHSRVAWSPDPPPYGGVFWRTDGLQGWGRNGEWYPIDGAMSVSYFFQHASLDEPPYVAEPYQYTIVVQFRE